MHKGDRIDWKYIFHPTQMIALLVGVASAVLAMKSFMIPNKFMDGGVTGVSILIHEIFHTNISLLIIGLNLPFIYLGFKRIGKTFAAQTSIAVLFLALGLQFLPDYSITEDKLLIAIFGGFFAGIGMGLVIRAGCVIDGAEIVAVLSTKKLSISINEVIMTFNTLIFILAAKYISTESAMYSIITYFTALRMCDYVSNGFEELIALNIISSKHDLIKSALVNDLKKGIVVFKGERGYLPGSFDVHEHVDIVVTIITRLELLKIKDAVYEIDSKAFMFVSSIKEAAGGVLKKKPSH